jgi:HD-like signal output (HDOD) protein
MPRILFVDDEQNVLDGLQNLLRKQRRQWDMVFALGGRAALEELGRGAFDVVVSDMRMPGMDGAELLTRVREEQPGAARIVLSGHAESEAVVRALPVAHQFLGKPCDAETLRIAVERTCELQRLLKDEAIRRVAGRLDKLPSVPRTYWELTSAIADPKVGVNDVAAIVERDPAMSVKVLQLVNSGYFGLARKMASIQQAVGYLGLELLKGLALTVHAFATARQAELQGICLDRIQEEALIMSKVCKRFSSDAKRAEEAFTAALVHDIGKIVVAMGMPEKAKEVARIAQQTGRPSHVIEAEQMGVTHAEVGGYLLGVWGLPFPIIEAVAFHHAPAMVTEGSRDVLAIVHAADALVSGEEESLDIAFLERVGLADRLPAWRAIAQEELHARRGG